jgi:NitT/TauT family transport system substrate-binding protein
VMFTRTLRCQLLLGCALLHSCDPHLDRKQLIPVRIMIGRSTGFLPVLIAEQLGMYRNQGLAVTIDDTSSTTKSTQALFGGSVDVAGGMYEQTLATALQGRTVTSFVTIMRGDFRALVISPSKTEKVHRVEDLKGGSIGVSAMGSPNQFFATSLIRRHDLSPKDVSMVAVGILTSAVAALEHDRVDAAVLAGSGINLYQKRHPNARILVDVRTAEGMNEAFGVTQFVTTVLYSTPGWLASHKEAARRLARGTCDGLRWVQDHSPDEIAKNMPESLRTEFDVDRDAVKALKESFSPDGLMSVDLASGVKQAFTTLPENSAALNVDLSNTFTNDFVAK